MLKQILRNINIILILTAFLGGGSMPVYAATNSGYEVSGWIPYWASVAGAVDAKNHLDKLDTLHPFGYSVKTDGTLNDLAQIDKNAPAGAAKDAWQALFKSARKKGIPILPTVMWSNGADMERILSDQSLRASHIKAITDMVKREKFDGVNIDYEGKLAATRDDFSIFLKELKRKLGRSKVLSCTIEARTPPESLYRVVPGNIQYSNDFKEIGRHCDQVEIMTYDQGRADFRLNGEKSGSPYVPVADKDWVRKVVELAIKDIPKKKIILGAATYGREYEVTVSPNRFEEYKRIRSVNPPLALDVAKVYGVIPSRNKAGELSFSFLVPSSAAAPSAFASMLPTLTVPAGTPSGEIISQKALQYANLTGQKATFNLIWWSDALAIEDKARLVEEFGLKGIAIFKIDAEEDPALWSMLK